MNPEKLRNIIIGELEAADIDEMLKLRNGIFSPISRDRWEAMGCTAAIAKQGKKILGAIPLQYRNYQITPKISLPVVFENAVGVVKEARGLGLGSAMLESVKEFIQDRAEALCLYRSTETSTGYKFYRKTGHGDICYISQYVLEDPKGDDNEVEVVSWDEAPALEGKLLSLYQKQYGSYSGCWERKSGYFKRVINSHVHGNKDCRLFILRRKKEIQGYAITNPHAFRDSRHYLYEFTAPRPRDAAAIFSKIKYTAARDGIPVGMFCNREHPARELLLAEGFKIGRHTRHLMALILRPERIFSRLAEKSFLLQELQLRVVTPHREMLLNDPKKPKASATIYLKESYFSRLMFRRLDLHSALKMDLVRMTPVDRRIEQALGKVFAFSPWAVFDMDYA